MNRFRILLGFGTVVAASGATHALPAFTQKEGKPCAYCHVNQAGSGPRNYRGLFYKQNKLSFAGFDDAAEAKKAGVEIGPNPTPPPKSYSPPPQEEPKSSAPSAQGPSKEPTKAATQTMTVAQATANLKAAQAIYTKAPNNATARKTYAEAIAQLGRSTMLDQAIPAMRRYPAALQMQRRALALDPSNKVALADKKQIEDVYKSMKRPIPK